MAARAAGVWVRRPVMPVVRRNLTLGLLATAVGVAIGLGSSASAEKPRLSFADLLSRERPLADRRIAYGSDPNQFGELWMPRRPRRARVVVVIHGGCWQAALPGLELMNGVAADLRRRGYAVWNIEYRRLGAPGGGYPGTFDDVGRAIDFLRVISRTDSLDLGHVVVLGHSAGGHLALWAAGRSRLPSESPLSTAHPLRIGGVITLAGINDLAAYRESGPDACGGPATIRSAGRGRSPTSRDGLQRHLAAEPVADRKPFRRSSRAASTLSCRSGSATTMSRSRAREATMSGRSTFRLRDISNSSIRSGRTGRRSRGPFADWRAPVGARSP